MSKITMALVCALMTFTLNSNVQAQPKAKSKAELKKENGNLKYAVTELRKLVKKFKTQCVCPGGLAMRCQIQAHCYAWAPRLGAKVRRSGGSWKWKKGVLEIKLKMAKAKYDAITDLARIHNGQPTVKAGKGININLNTARSAPRQTNDPNDCAKANMIPVRIDVNRGVVEAKESGEAEGHTRAQIYTCQETETSRANAALRRAQAAATLARAHRPRRTHPAFTWTKKQVTIRGNRSGAGWIASIAGGMVVGFAGGFGGSMGYYKDDLTISETSYEHESPIGKIAGWSVGMAAVGAAAGGFIYWLATKGDKTEVKSVKVPIVRAKADATL